MEVLRKNDPENSVIRSIEECFGQEFKEKISHSDLNERNKSSKNRLEHIGRYVLIQYFREFDPGSGRTLAACLTHASRTELT